MSLLHEAWPLAPALTGQALVDSWRNACDSRGWLADVPAVAFRALVERIDEELLNAATHRRVPRGEDREPQKLCGFTASDLRTLNGFMQGTRATLPKVLGWARAGRKAAPPGRKAK